MAEVDISGLEAAYAQVERQIRERAADEVDSRAQKLCNVLNYQIGMVSTEAMFDDGQHAQHAGQQETSGKAVYYDPQHAKKVESDLLRKFADVFVAVVESGEDELSKRVIVKTPEDMTISDLVKDRLNMALANAKRMLNMNSFDYGGTAA